MWINVFMVLMPSVRIHNVNSHENKRKTMKQLLTASEFFCVFQSRAARLLLPPRPTEKRTCVNAVCIRQAARVVAVAAAYPLHLHGNNKPHFLCVQRQLQVGISPLSGRRESAPRGSLIKHGEILMPSPDLHLFSASSVSAPNNHPRGSTRSLCRTGSRSPFLSPPPRSAERATLAFWQWDFFSR